MRTVRLRDLLQWLVVLVVLAQAGTALAGIDNKYPELRQVFPEATRFGDIEGTPPAAAVYHDNHVVGYAFETVMVAPIPAYSGKPINVLVAIGTDGSIRSTRVLYQDEPILLVGIPVQKLYDFVARYVGHHVDDHIVVGGGGPGSVNIDAISGATVTAMVANDTIMNSALEVAASRKLVQSDTGTPGVFAHVRTDNYQLADWSALTGNGAIAHLYLTRQAVAEPFKGEQAPGLIDDPTAPPSAGHGNDTFIDLYYADVTPPTVGRNLLGDSAYSDLMQRLKPGDTAVALMANGIYSFKGLGYVRGGVFDRVHLLQDGKLTLFKDSDLIQMGDSPLKGIPTFAERAIFIARHGSSFDATAPWTLQLLVRRQVGPLDSIYHTFTGSYRMPADYITGQATKPFGGIVPANAPMWVQVWYAQRYKIAVLVAGLGFLLVVLTFQDWLTKRKRLFERVRVGFLIYTLVFIGWYGLAQLSVVNILTFIHSVLNHFTWNTFLMDPMVFILWVFVAVMLLLFGRGIYCGWLCPFGALQELVSRAARKLKVPQLEFPPFVHERMWAIKYIILLGLVGVSLQSVAAAERLAEVEPFKTAIILHFARSWGFVAYAVAMVAVSAVNERFYCRYVCPLGGGLAVSGKFHLFEWLRRRKECGHPCQICAVDCPVKAIDPLGRINYNECVYCLECQVDYNDEYKCPPLVQRRKIYERAAQTAAVAAARTSPGINHPVPLRPPARPTTPKEDATP